MAASLFIDLDGNPLHESSVLGYGRTGVVIRRDNLVIKTPLRYFWSSDSDVEANMEVIAREQGIFARFNSLPKQTVDGIVPCVGLLPDAIQLIYMANGDLRTYLQKKENKSSRAVQLTWFRQMARALTQVHAARVLAADIATRNFLLDADLSVKICDFSEASLLPLEIAMETADDGGFSVQTDIGQLGAVMYEVVTGQRCDFDLFKGGIPDDGRAIWLPRDSLPSTDGLWLGPIIEKCWVKGGFQNADALLRALDSVDLERNEEVHPEKSQST
ncbi:serine/threonine-protein kinase HT1 [Aspergillus steynii IBT 23096]|uniref:Serine/threonine-protein kinase HT1 n=1 Tax=Aspergillus steynii IBT 23096 TaxID=1392250 RepID=A0A2I2GK50_9EURO|nr:serine/threonine-protein kinase HT1 [Aspergillus steynii IBT 23096]PLB53251.1 serine/threonine-protein kinase HT1 [Aspergillus steynii IBT 23096]